MYHWLDEPRHGHERVSVPVVWMTAALSLLVHLVALFFWLPHSRIAAPWEDDKEANADRLQVRLAQLAPPAPPSPPAAAPTQPAPRQPPPRPRETETRAKIVALAPTPRAITVPSPPAQAPAFPTPPPQSATPPPARPTQPAETDLMSYVQARRRERGETDASSESSEQPSLSTALAANLPRAATGVAAQDRRRGGGLFEIKRMNYDDAAFEFFGWNADMERKTPQLIEVRKGNNEDMQIAVVRRMIAIIREHTKEDFVWRSVRRGQDFTLSARPADNAALEDFMKHEFFDDPRQAQ